MLDPAMRKRYGRSVADGPERAPETYGELRKLLAEAGDPWQPDPTRSDDEPLPEYLTGGDGNFEPEDRVLGEGGVDEVLKKGGPPSNPDLRAAWREEGLLPEGEEDNNGRTPAPDSGG
jgi:hypothetical protein